MKTQIIILILASIVLAASYDITRPGYHFTSPINWLNDPNGPMYYKGLYHLFYQNNPVSNAGGLMLWGHAISYNLIDWFHLDVALHADTPADVNGVWSGSTLIDDNGIPWLVYTGVDGSGTQATCSARPADPNDPLLQKWVKNPNNPIFKQPFANLTGGFRDPNTPWKNPVTGQWNMLVGTGKGPLKTAVTTLWQTKDLDNNWNFVGFFRECQRTEFCDGFYECGDFFSFKTPQTNKQYYIFKYSDGADYYAVGNYDPSKTQWAFEDIGIETMVDWGKASWYASKSWVDSKNNRRLWWGWLREMGSGAGNNARGWQGAQALRLTTFTEDRMIALNPIPEMETLRQQHFAFQNVVLYGGNSVPLKGAFTAQTDIVFTIPNLDNPFGLNVRTAPDHSEFTRITFNLAGSLPGQDLLGGDFNDYLDTDTAGCQQHCDSDVGCMSFTWLKAGVRDQHSHCFVKRSDQINNSPNANCNSGYKAHVNLDCSKSSTTEPVNSYIMPIGNQTNLDVRIMIDQSIIEIFINGGRYSMTTRIYPNNPDSTGIEFFGISGTTTLPKIDVWNMRSSFENFSDLPLVVSRN